MDVIKAKQQHGLYICENLVHICVHCHQVLEAASLFSACVEVQAHSYLWRSALASKANPQMEISVYRSQEKGA